MVLKSSFHQPIGSASDVKELEYCAALHKTGEDTPKELVKPAIKAEDVQAFLLSRYGIQVSRDEVLTLIFQGLAGGDSENDCIDIVELVAILIIPYLVKLISEKDYKAIAAQQLVQSSDSDPLNQKIHEIDGNEEQLDLLSVDGSCMVTDVLNIILADVFGSCKPHQRLTKKVLRKIFSTYGELDLIDDDDLLEEMINAASDGDPNCLLNTETFARALTNDLDLYDVNAETRLSTNFEDVFGMGAEGGIVKVQKNNDEENSEAVQTGRNVQTVFSFSSLDFLAGTFRVKAHFIVIWMALMHSFATYRSNQVVAINVCNDGVDNFGCTVANNIIGWIVILTIFTCYGIPFVIILSLGNQVKTASIWEILLALAGIILFIFIPSFSTFNWKIGETIIFIREDDGSNIYEFTGAIGVFLGCILTLFQIWNIVRWYSNGKISEKLPNPGGAVTDETRVKQASKLKVAQMVKNAYDLHEGSRGQSSYQSSLLKFNQISSGELKKPVGGLMWCWKHFLSGKLLSEQGIWIPSKAIVGLVSMFWVFTSAFIINILVINALVNGIFPKDVKDVKETEEKCHPLFDPIQTCSYPKDINGKYYGTAVCAMDLPECLENKTDNLSENLQLALYCSLLQDAYTQNSAAFQYVDYMQNPYIDVGATIGNITGDADIPDFSPCSKIDVLSPELIIPKPNETIYAVAIGSIDETNYCAAPLSVCATYTIPGSSDKSTMCILGLYSGPDVIANAFLPKFTGELCSNYTTVNEINQEHTGLNAITNKNFAVSKAVLSTALYSGPCFAYIYGSLTAFGFIPSLIITVLKFRSGVIPLLRDEKLVVYRNLLQSTTRLIGATFWGAVFSYNLFAQLISLIVFITLWKPTQKIVLQIIAFIVGLSITIMLRMLLVAHFRSFFAGFYRKKSPAFGNVFNLALESWDFGITSGYILVRFVKMIVITFSYIGRFDTPLLSEDANDAGCFYIDTFPLILRSSLLAMEAHRHPYLERLGLLYMMKLKYSDKFARKSGSTWRLLFVFALMPWLRKFRVSNETDIDEYVVQEMYGASAKKLIDLETEIKRLKSSKLLLQSEDDTIYEETDEDEPLIANSKTSTRTQKREDRLVEEYDKYDENKLLIGHYTETPIEKEKDMQEEEDSDVGNQGDKLSEIQSCDLDMDESQQSTNQIEASLHVSMNLSEKGKDQT